MDLAQQSDAQILLVANPIMDNLMEASTAVDHARHTRDFTDRRRHRLSEAQLQCICQEYQSTKGTFAAREFVAVFRRPDSVAVVWRQHFTRQAGDFVAEMVLGQQDGKYLVDHVMVF